jgi:uncharacterized membrane protein HdeD (DUF308 family)
MGRIPVSDVRPLVDGGTRPAKSVVDEEFTVRAKVFREGHDAVNATAVLVQLLGWYWLVDGIIRLVSIFVNPSGWGWKLCMGILGIILGIAVIQHPLWSTILIPTTLVYVVGFMGMAIGILQVIAAFRGAGWGTGILGVCSFLLGLVLIFNPLSGLVALPFVLGFLALIGGIIAPILALGRRYPMSSRT